MPDPALFAFRQAFLPTRRRRDARLRLHMKNNPRALLALLYLHCLAGAYAQGDFSVVVPTPSAAAEGKRHQRDYYPPTEADLARCSLAMQQWVAQIFPRSVSQDDRGRPQGARAAPFSFVYGGRPSGSFLADWDYFIRDGINGQDYIASYTDPKTKLRIDCEIKTHPDTAAVDWVLRLTNTGDRDTPIIENLLPLDSAILAGGNTTEGSATLRWSNGDRFARDAFLAHDEKLEPGKVRPFQGYSSMHRVPPDQVKNYCFPFFNVQMPGGGMILAVGWTGRWKAEFQQDKDGIVSARAGMQNTHFYLKPGEQVRTPRIVLMQWVGREMVYGHNQFRQMMLRHYTPWRDGKPAEPPVTANNTAGVWIRGQTRLHEKGELAFINTLESIGCEAYWLDAYWYLNSLPHGDWLKNIGNWIPSPGDFPHGLRPLADAAHAKGMKFILWFIPYNASKGTKMAKDFSRYFYSRSADGGLWNLADPAARKVLLDWMAERQKEWGFDIWRDDGGNSMPPNNDPDRQGVAEMMWYDGMYRFWDELVERMPDLLIDNTNGGGNRIDFETNSRSFCQWRSDFNDIGEGLKGKQHWPAMALADQVMVAGLFHYLPVHSGPVWDMRPYSFRSAMTSGIVLYNNLEDPAFPFELARQGIAELKELRPCFQGDVYPLLPIGIAEDSWYAYQLDRPDLKMGCAFFFRRPQSPYLMSDVTLYNIRPEADYQVSVTGETYEQGPWLRMKGAELMKREIKIPGKPGSALLRYKQVVE